ncbi:MAG: hypothetical protein GY870_16075 [archaeon]|nr:hypothetical protein [archaeon]
MESIFDLPESFRFISVILLTFTMIINLILIFKYMKIARKISDFEKKKVTKHVSFMFICYFIMNLLRLTNIVLTSSIPIGSFFLRLKYIGGLFFIYSMAILFNIAHENFHKESSGEKVTKLIYIIEFTLLTIYTIFGCFYLVSLIYFDISIEISYIFPFSIILSIICIFPFYHAFFGWKRLYNEAKKNMEREQFILREKKYKFLLYAFICLAITTYMQLFELMVSIDDTYFGLINWIFQPFTIIFFIKAFNGNNSKT